MTAELKIQIDAIKSRDFLGGLYQDTAMITEGHFIVYIKSKELMIDVSKLREFQQSGMERYSAETIREKMKPAILTEKAIINGTTIQRCFDCGEDGESYINNKYYKMFVECKPFYFVDDNTNIIVFTRYEDVIGIVLPITRRT